MDGKLALQSQRITWKLSGKSLSSAHITIPRSTLQEVFDAFDERQVILQYQIDELLAELPVQKDENRLRQEGDRIAVELDKMRRFLQIVRRQLLPDVRFGSA
ncbi:MAG: hypothetical protein K0041_04940 [Acidithiobacillus sp.]|nr:hypothetical protein [Acidithiobacillus sp.]